LDVDPPRRATRRSRAVKNATTGRFAKLRTSSCDARRRSLDSLKRFRRLMIQKPGDGRLRCSSIA